MIVIVLALAATAATLIIGVMSMSYGGSADGVLSTPLMWARVGLQALTLVLLLVAALLKAG